MEPWLPNCPVGQHGKQSFDQFGMYNNPIRISFDPATHDRTLAKPEHAKANDREQTHSRPTLGSDLARVDAHVIKPSRVQRTSRTHRRDDGVEQSSNAVAGRVRPIRVNSSACACRPRWTSAPRDRTRLANPNGRTPCQGRRCHGRSQKFDRRGPVTDGSHRTRQT